MPAHRSSLASALRAVTLTALAGGLAPGCSGDLGSACEGDGCGPAPDGLKSLETRLSARDVLAGTAVGIECIAGFEDGTSKVLSPPIAGVAISPQLGLEPVDGGVRALVSGDYTITCRSGDFRGATSAPLFVYPAAPSVARVTLDRSRVTAGDVVNAACRVEDDYGNEVPGIDFEIRSSPVLSSRIVGRQIHTSLAGEQVVSCLVLGLRLEKIPAILVVEPGEPADMIAWVENPWARAGTRVNVECLIVDAHTNAVQRTTQLSISPAPASVDATGFLPYTAADYQVTCVEPISGLTSPPTLVRVATGLPADLTIIEVQPALQIYAGQTVIRPVVVVNDAFGNRIPNAPVVITGVPVEGVADLGRGEAWLQGNGPQVVVVSAQPPTHDGSPVSDSVELLVDGEAPQVVFTFPQRAELVVGPAGQTITIQGTVTDGLSGLAQLLVNGNTVSVAANGSFSAPMATAWGINTLEVQAFDQVGNERHIAQSFEHATAYRRASPTRTVSGRIADGITAHLSQAALDDNNNDIDDLATIARLAIQNMNIRALIPSPVTTFNSDCSILFVTITGQLRLHVDDVRFGAPAIDITTRNGGLFLSVRIPSVVVDMHTTGDVCDINIGVSGTASASSIVVSGNLNISKSGANIAVSMPSPNVQINGLNINLNLPSIIDWAVDGIISLFRNQIASQLQSAFANVIRTEIPPVIRDFLQSFDLGTGFALPAPLNLTLNVASGLGTVGFNTGGGTIGFDTTIYSTGTITPEPRGGIMQNTLAAPNFDTSRALGVALSYDLINQAFYSLWYGGGLNLDLTNAFGSSGGGGGTQVQAQLTGLLPPVFRPTGDVTWPLELQVGDLQLDLLVDGLPNLPPINLRIYAAARLRASASITAGDITLTMAPNPQLTLEVSGPIGQIDLGPLVPQIEHVLELLIPQIFTQVLQGIPIPNIDLSALAGTGLPPGIVLGLGNPRIGFQPSHLLLEGNVVQVP